MFIFFFLSEPKLYFNMLIVFRTSLEVLCLNGNSFQHSCLESPMDGGAWRATVRRVTRVGHDLVTKPPQAPLDFYLTFV